MHKPTLKNSAPRIEKSTCFEDRQKTACSSSQTLAGVAVLDLVHLSRQTMGDVALETELLTLFNNQALQFADRLADPAMQGEDKWRGDLAHTLKGSALSIGAFKLARAAANYEDSIRVGAGDQTARWRTLAAAIAETRSAISELLERN